MLPDHEALHRARARQLAQEIAANSPLAVQGSKQVLGFAVRREVDAALDYVALWNSAFLHSDDLDRGDDRVHAAAQAGVPRAVGSRCLLRLRLAGAAFGVG